MCKYFRFEPTFMVNSLKLQKDAILTTEFLKMSLICSVEELGFGEEAATYTYCQE